MALAARINKPFLAKNSIIAVDLEDEDFCTSATQHTPLKSLSASYSRKNASRENDIHNACVQTLSIEAKSAEDDYFTSVLVEQMASAMLNEESETGYEVRKDEVRKAYEVANWKTSCTCTLCERDLRSYQEPDLQSINCTKDILCVDRLCGESKNLYPFVHNWLNDANHHCMLADNYATSVVNSHLLENSWRFLRERECTEHVFPSNYPAFPVSSFLLPIDPSTEQARRQSSEATFIRPSLWTPSNRASNHIHKNSASTGCAQRNNSQFEQSQSNIKPSQNYRSRQHENPNVAYCNHVKAGAGVPMALRGRTAASKESVGTGVFLPRSHSHGNGSNRKPARSHSKTPASSNSKAPESLAYSSNKEKDFDYRRKALLSVDEPYRPMQLRLPSEWTY